MASFPPTILTETLGTKLRRLARSAAQRNPLLARADCLPLKAVAAWAQSTAYVQGQVRANGGGLYVCVQNGTSASSGTGPSFTPTGSLHSPIADGTTYWSYWGTNPVTADDATAPAITTNLSQAATGGSSWWYPVKWPQAFAFRGCYPVQVDSFSVSLYTFNRAAPGNTAALYPRSPSVAFVTDAPKVNFGLGSSQYPVRVIIDGRYLSLDPLIPGANQYITLDFTAVGGRREREIEIEYWNNTAANTPAFLGLYIDPVSYVRAPVSADKITACFISDSIWDGSNIGPFVPGNNVPRNIGKYLGWSDNWAFTIGGTGYNNRGASYNNFRDRVPELLTRNPNIVVLFGSTNDDQSAATQANILGTLRDIRAGTSAPIVVFGLWPCNNANVALNEPMVKAQVTAFADPNTFFIPLYSDSIAPWINDTWNNAGQNGNPVNTGAKNSNYYIGGDNLHPPDIGTSWLSRRMALAIADQVLPNIR